MATLLLHKHIRVLLALAAALLQPVLAASQAQPAKGDTAVAQADAAQRSIHQGSTPFLETQVKYKASDSLAFDFETKKMYLFGNAEIEYGEVSLTAHAIELDMDSTTAYAYGKKDSLGVITGSPVFKDKSGEYEMREMRYNFKTKKAIITHIVTEQGEGFVVGQRAKRVDEKTYFMKDAKYTTCDHHDHPHFYLNLTKAKVIPGKKTVTGPAYLVIEDVPLPIAIPFAIIPNSRKYSSGIIIPTYGDESSRGFYLRNGGYYLAASDYFDVKILGDIYTKGSWGLHLSSTYKKRYKFSGSFSADYIVNVTSEKDLPDYQKTKDFSIRWNHSQDSKANPDQTFTASVNFSTSSYNKNNVTNRVDPNVLSTNQKSSSITYSRKWSWNPFRLTASLQHSQNSRDTSISLTLPKILISSSKRFYPFKPKKLVGANNNPIYNINLSYSFDMQNNINCKEKDLTFEPSSFSTVWKNGAKHSIPISTDIKMLKYFTLSPSMSYTERWYLSKTRQYWNEEKQRIEKSDPEMGFNRVYDYNFSVSTSTKLYAFYRPIRALFGDKVNAIRQVMTPSVSFAYTPDFSTDFYGFYDNFEYYDSKRNEIVKYKYCYYNGYAYGMPSSAKSGKINLSLDNNLEMKIKSDRDSTGFSKISILESLKLSSGYDIMKDSMHWDNVRVQGRTKIFDTSVNFNAEFDPYGVVATEAGKAVRIDKSALSVNDKLAYLKTAGLSFGYQLSPKTFQRKDKNDKSNQNDDDDIDEDWALTASQSEEMQPGAQIPKDQQNNDEKTAEGNDGYVKFSMPWSLSINFSMNVRQDKFNPETCSYKLKFSSNVNVSGNISLTPKWKISASSGYSFDEKKISQTSIGVTRDLHCWSMSFNIVPTGAYKSYNFNIAISSSILKDLKYEQSNSPRDNGYRR
ncbi:MAG: LPS-assembly protein LptD [Bacteroidales bacterium]|nr:LPS-assembly protein LptD [Bacteroidales bacterium]